MKMVVKMVIKMEMKVMTPLYTLKNIKVKNEEIHINP
jgi:hypothetical protein